MQSVLLAPDSFVTVKYFAAEGLIPQLVRASARASLNSVCSRGWSWPCGLPVSTSPVLRFLGFTITPVVCGVGDRTQGLAMLSKRPPNLETHFIHLTSWGWRIIITCFKISLKLTKEAWGNSKCCRYIWGLLRDKWTWLQHGVTAVCYPFHLTQLLLPLHQLRSSFPFFSHMWDVFLALPLLTGNEYAFLF